MLFRSLAQFALGRQGLVGGSVLILTAAAVLVGFPPRIEGDLLGLLPDDDPAARALIAHRKRPGGEGAIALTVPAEADRAAIAQRLEALATVRTTFHGLDDALGLKLAMLQFSPEQLDALTKNLQMAIARADPDLVRIPDIRSPPLPWAVDAGAAPSPANQQSADRVIFVVPEQSVQDPAFSERLLTELETAVPEATWITGPHTEIASAARELRQDFRNTSIYSLVLVMIVVGIAFRHVAGMLILVPPLLAANVMAIALIQVLAGSLNMYTSMGSAILLGLGIDFGVHLVSRFREELATGLLPEAAVQSAWEKTGPPCLTAALTSASGFLVLMVADFRGLSQLGLLLAMGVLLSLLMMLLILPILLTRVSVPARPSKVNMSGGRRYLPWGVGAALLITVGLASQLPKLAIEYDISAIRSQGLGWDELTVAQRGYRQNAFPPVVIRATDRSALHARLREALDRGELSHVREVVSLDTLLPPDQDRRLDALAPLIELANHPGRDLLPPRLRDPLERIGTLDTERVLPEHLPPGLAHLLGAGDERVLLLLQGNMLDLRVAHAMAQELEAYKEQAANAFLAQASVYEELSEDLPRVGVLALLVVLIIICADLHKPRLIAIAAGSLVLGMFWAFGGLAAFNVRINMVNVVALPMLLGIGIDVVVHLLHRLRAGGGIENTMRTTGVAVLVSTLTTIVAFLSLIMAENRGLQSMGMMILIGLSAIFLAAILVVSSSWHVVQPENEMPDAR